RAVCVVSYTLASKLGHSSPMEVNNGPTGNSILTRLALRFAVLPHRSIALHVPVVAVLAAAARVYPVETGVAHQLAAAVVGVNPHRIMTRGVAEDLPDLGIRATTRLHRSKTPNNTQIPSRRPAGSR